MKTDQKENKETSPQEDTRFFQYIVCKNKQSDLMQDIANHMET